MARYIVEVSKTGIIEEEEEEKKKKERKKERLKKEEEKKHLLDLEHSPRGIIGARGMLQN